jgi:hypothetical protein
MCYDKRAFTGGRPKHFGSFVKSICLKWLPAKRGTAPLELHKTTT